MYAVQPNVVTALVLKSAEHLRRTPSLYSSASACNLCGGRAQQNVHEAWPSFGQHANMMYAGVSFGSATIAAHKMCC